MEKLDLKHLAPYLPYRLQFIHNTVSHPYEEIVEMTGEHLKSNMIDLIHKPILRPLSDLTKEIEHNGEKFVTIHLLTNRHDINNAYNIIDDCKGKRLEYYQMEVLFAYHFDVFGLIEKGLAISYNDVVTK